MNNLAQFKQLFLRSLANLYSNESKIQDELAPFLRKKAIEHLETSQSVLAKAFRGDYFACNNKPYQNFLSKQAKSGTWGTYIEAAALGAEYGFHVLVTPIAQGKNQDPFFIYRTEADDAPIIHLYNRDNRHWFVNEKTKRNGNCLYNAFAQAGLKLVEPDLRFIPLMTDNPKASSNTYSFLQKERKKEQKIIIKQREIEASFALSPRPSEIEISLNEEAQRISQLSAPEQKQIAEDYQLALKLAQEEIGCPVKNLYPRLFNTTQAVVPGL